MFAHSTRILSLSIKAIRILRQLHHLHSLLTQARVVYYPPSYHQSTSTFACLVLGGSHGSDITIVDSTSKISLQNIFTASLSIDKRRSEMHRMKDGFL